MPERTTGGLSDAVEIVQQLIAGETGDRLGADGERRLTRVLRDVIRREAQAYPGEHFLTRDVTILLADLRGFTSTSAEHPVAIVLEMLNRYLASMSEVIARHDGTIDKFMGDSIMVLFGAPIAHPDDVKHALACAVEMQNQMVTLNSYHRRLGLPELYMGIGINTGTVMAGSVGSELYSAYTVIGDEVNLASRIESFSLRGQILISQATYDRCGDFLVTGGPMEVFVKGKSLPVPLREVLAIPSLNMEVPRQEMRRSPRVEVRIPFTYQVIQNKIVIPEVRHGLILDMGYYGLLAELDDTVALYSDIQLAMDIPVIGARATDIYAKVVKNIERDGRRLSGIEFTSVGAQSETDIRHFVQLLIQGSENA